MRYEPSINQQQLIEAVQHSYGIRVVELVFVPVGFAAVCYQARSTDGMAYFLKVWPDSQLNRATIIHRDTTLRLMQALYERSLYRHVPAPLSTRSGALRVICTEYMFALFPWLHGTAPPVPMPHALVGKWAEAMAVIHRATLALTDVLPLRETFALPFEADLRRSLYALVQMRIPARPSVQALRDLVLPRAEEIFVQLYRLHHLQRIVAHLPSPFVLCHTDMGGDNLLVDERGHINVLDWDEAMVAPPEHDLHEARNEEFDDFLAAYGAAGGMRPLHLDHFAFYLLRRHLADMTARVQRILHENMTDEADQDALQGIEDWGFVQWRTLDATLERMSPAIHRYNRVGAG